LVGVEQSICREYMPPAAKKLVVVQAEAKFVAFAIDNPCFQARPTEWPALPVQGTLLHVMS
jgi:hypothetical protein